ncbi:CAF17-like 4Fe-4S cluster assembly/insertion protein YgfZ [Methyloversatilis thermotolerans]|uniref:CAF17-like 4Fe-4S cluster assembly/insertion protein YgfZ n=1 Tax=Methyloversatilis thermotolerans TaxID=1346290 RepID=UPI0003A8F9DA|nr:folate-binding protein YgfZ [Methyloversatilis thermotolerans]
MDLPPAGTLTEDGQFAAVVDASEEMRAAREGTVLVPLTHLARLRAEGEDAATFLHNLMTNDVKSLSADDVRYAGFCTAKGRMLASFLIWRDSAGIVLQLPQGLAEALRKKLAMYILRAKATLTDGSAALPALGLAGRGAEAALSAAGLPVPAVAMTQAQADGVAVLRLASDRFEILPPPERLESVWRALAAHATPAGSPAWRWFDIRDGLASIWPATQEEFVPQMVNFELSGGVSFKKGCYPGQEIVARTQYLGKLKRRMYRASADCAPPAPGTPVYGRDTKDQACGAVVDAVALPDGGCELLAVVQMSSTEAGPVTLGSLSGSPLSFLPLPYALGENEG